MARPWFAADHYSVALDARWEVLKAEGNAQLKAGELARAADLYTEALAICEADREPDRPDTDDDGAAITLHVPCRAAAICLANRSNAKLRLGDGAGALADAEAACLRCPEYVKGHSRRVEAYEKLGDREAAARVKEEIEIYLQGAGEALAGNATQWYAFGLCFASWISYYELVNIYNQANLEYCLARARDTAETSDWFPGEGPPPKIVNLIASVISPDCRGQWLLIIMRYKSQDGTEMNQEAITLICVDTGKGKEYITRVSKKGLKNAIENLEIVVEYLQSHGLDVLSCTLGEGLIDFKESIAPVFAGKFRCCMVMEALDHQLKACMGSVDEVLFGTPEKKGKKKNTKKERHSNDSL